MTLLKGFFNYAISKKRLVGDNPANDIKAYAVDESRREYTPQELTRILQAAKEIEDKAKDPLSVERNARSVILLLLYTAMRPGELFSLKWENVRDHKIVFKRTETKQKDVKEIPITDRIRRILEDLREQGSPAGYVIPLRPGINREQVFVHDLFKAIREKSGVSDFIFYNIKHTAATVMVTEALGRGASLRDVMKILGHRRVETTLKYVHADFDRMKKAMLALEDVVDKKDRSG